MLAIQSEHNPQPHIDYEEDAQLELDELDIDYTQMHLKVHQHRKHNSYHHPKFMLNEDETDWYISAVNPHFKHNEHDWIILNDKQKENIIVPLWGEIQCNGYIQDVKSMRLEIGNFEHNKWMPLNRNNAPIRLPQSKDIQRFELDIDDINIVTISQMMQQQDYHHFRLTLIENHGAKE
eukprot:99769_1